MLSPCAVRASPDASEPLQEAGDADRRPAGLSDAMLGLVLLSAGAVLLAAAPAALPFPRQEERPALDQSPLSLHPFYASASAAPSAELLFRHFDQHLLPEDVFGGMPQSGTYLRGRPLTSLPLVSPSSGCRPPFLLIKTSRPVRKAKLGSDNIFSDNKR